MSTPTACTFLRCYTVVMDEQLFWSKVRIGSTEECWPWTAATCPKGYGLWSHKGKTRRAHRVAWILTNGPIPGDLSIDHMCRNTGCSNPVHLRLLTRSENSRDNGQARRTHCPQGHEYTPENTYVYTNPKGHRTRACRTCTIARAQRDAPNRLEYHRKRHAERYVPKPRVKPTHCPQGHEYTPENRTATIHCKECNRIRARANHAKKKAALATGNGSK
jgi:HNH endonuclease